jgi:hypothetical protein
LLNGIRSCSSCLLLKLNIYVWPLCRSLNHIILSALYACPRRVAGHLVCFKQIVYRFARTGLELSAPLFRCPLLHGTHWTVSRPSITIHSQSSKEENLYLHFTHDTKGYRINSGALHDGLVRCHFSGNVPQVWTFKSSGMLCRVDY